MIYFDNSATTKPSEKVKEAINRNLNEELFGNPGSLHKMGVVADKEYQKTFKRAADVLGCDNHELYFTSCGTESANTAIYCYAHKYSNRFGKTIVSTRTEHKATLEVLLRLEKEGYNIKYLPVDKAGKPDLSVLEEILSEGVLLMCFTHVNNETGSILQLDEIVSLRNTKCPSAALYVDMVQSLGKLEINLHKMGVDMASFSGHKIHSVKGVGMLYIKKEIRIEPYIMGGGQQNGMRSGTQSLLLADAFVTALEEISSERTANYDKVAKINSYLREELTKRGHMILSPDDALPYVLNVSFEGFESETMLHSLEIYDIFVSTVSACSSKTKKVSYVLLEMGVDRKIAANAVRLSFSGWNTMEEAEEFIRKVDEIYSLFALKR